MPPSPSWDSIRYEPSCVPNSTAIGLHSTAAPPIVLLKPGLSRDFYSRPGMNAAINWSAAIPGATIGQGHLGRTGTLFRGQKLRPQRRVQDESHGALPLKQSTHDWPGTRKLPRSDSRLVAKRLPTLARLGCQRDRE